MNGELGDGLLLTRIVIERRVCEDGSYAVFSTAEDVQGDTPPLVESLGMLELTKDSLIRAVMEEGV